MRNAFDILGATPLDDASKIRELFEEKQLFADDESEISFAFTELTNIKKRIKHEIEYFSKDTFKDFNDIFVNEDEEQELVLEDVCGAIITIGKWFDRNTDEIFDEINNNRQIASFSLISNKEVVYDAVQTMKENCILEIKQYFDYLKEKDIVSLFNILVLQDNYSSFFIDELLNHYEAVLKETIDKKAKLCSNKFDLIKADARSFIDNNNLDENFKVHITEFKKALNAWDKIVQPLQINCENRGMEHPTSSDFIHILRNDVIEMCNDSQTKLTDIIKTLSYDYGARNRFINRAYKSVDFIDLLTEILNVLLNVFKEITVVAERLKQDKQDFANLKAELNKIINTADPYHYQKPRTPSFASNTNASSNSSGGFIPSTPRKTVSVEDKWEIAVKWIFGLVIALSFILGIVFLSNEMTGGGAVLIILGIVASIVAYQWGQLNISFNPARVTSIVLACIMTLTIIITASVGSGSSGSSSGSSGGNYATSYTITLNKQGGYGGSSSVKAYYGDEMPYATKPSKSGYTFEGYFTSTNGKGTKYYNSDMNSVRDWDCKYDDTLYAYWVEIDDSITLTSSNFENYFTLTSSCSTSSSGYSTTATYEWSIKPKSSFYYNNSKNPSSISVTIGLDISFLSSSYGTPSEYKIYVTLYKSQGYKASGSKTYSIASNERYWIDGIYAASGKIYD